MSLRFRNGTLADVPGAARLAAHSFPAVGHSLAEWEGVLTGEPGGVDALWVGEEGGELVAACRLFSFGQWIGGAEVPIMGLGTVAISPFARRRGLAGRMVESGFRRALERGDVASALYPFRTAFYRKAGYGMAGEILQYHIPPAALPDDPGRKQVRLAISAEDRRAIEQIYARWVPGQSGQLSRCASAWERVWQGGSREGALFEEDGRAMGYVVFRYAADVPRGGRVLEVEEIVWLSRAARLALYGWLASLSDQWDHLLYRAHPEEAFAEHMAELRYPTPNVPRWHFWFPAAVAMNGPMFRLLDLPGAWAMRSCNPEFRLTVALEVEDPVLEENTGAWTLRLEEGRASIERGMQGGADVRLRAGIEPLSRIFIGALTPSAAVLAGLANVDRADLLARLDLALQLPKPWTFDRF